ncbi:MAG: DNA mismatch repair protein MutL, partial [Pirellulales bacterium]|nr:DNA mismatch repair protein MutL [Pirellulales bacterium]
HVRVRGEHEDSTGAHDDAQAAKLREELIGWAKGKVAGWKPGSTGQDSGSFQRTFDANTPPGSAEPLTITQLDRSWAPAEGDAVAAGEPVRRDHLRQPEPCDAAGRIGTSATVAGPPRAVQVHDRYLVTESDDGLMIVDQHALHERILYEQLRDRIARSGLETQTLLVPEPIDLPPAEAAAALEHRKILAKLGMNVEPFGGDTVLISGYPAMLANMNPAEVLRSLLETLMAGGHEPNRDALLEHLLHAIACHAAIKAGDRLAPEEITSLLEQRHLVKDAHHCPHGRPTALVFTREELDKQFKRI